MRRQSSALATQLLGLVTVILLPATGLGQIPVRVNPQPTALDQYVAAPDPHYAWQLIGRQQQDECTIYTVALTSQAWRRAEEVDRPLWKHWLTVIQPAQATSDTALMFIGGGRNGRAAPDRPDARLLRIARATQSVVAQLQMIPNQPLVFHGDGIARVEDDLIAYTWDQYLKTGDATWPARLPMVKSVVRAMDTVQTLMQQPEVQGPALQQFVIAGASKRGWTTWMTAAVDRRVAAIVPLVIDVLNVDLSIRHHYAAYGYWAPAIQDYVRHQIPQRRHHPRYADLLQLVDPFAYRNRYTMPKCIINAAGDEFFLPDSSRFYFDELPGEKHLSYVPNTNHSLQNSDAFDTLLAFYYAIVHRLPRPEYRWTYQDENTLHVTSQTPPARVLLWQASNPQTRDFRLDMIGPAYRSRPLHPDPSGRYTAQVPTPARGWTAYFVQLQYDLGAPVPLQLTTPVRVLPQRLPFNPDDAPLLLGSPTP